MSQNDPLRPSGDQRIQAMPCRYGGASITSVDGAQVGCALAECIEDGVISVTFPDGSVEPYTRYQGMVKSLPIGGSVTVISGTFDLA